MKALHLDAVKRLTYREVPLPTVGTDDVLIRVRACGICGSDVHGYDGGSGRRTPPLIMGHEASGVVAEAGSGVSEWRAGDRVALNSIIHCGECPQCMSGRLNLCDRREVVGAAFDRYRRDGAFAEFVLVPARSVTRLPDSLSFERAALAEPTAVALHAVTLARVVETESVAVVGTGFIGLLVIQVLRGLGVKLVIGIDLDRDRLAIARAVGADVVFQVGSADVESGVLELTDGRGADAVVEVVGLTASVGTAITCTARGGRIVLVGNISSTVEMHLQSIVASELTLLGSCASSLEFGRALELLATNDVDVEPMISAVAPLRDGASWFDRLHAAEPGLMKVILVPSPVGGKS